MIQRTPCRRRAIVEQARIKKQTPEPIKKDIQKPDLKVSEVVDSFYNLSVKDQINFMSIVTNKLSISRINTNISEQSSCSNCGKIFKTERGRNIHAARCRGE